jgi:hypothetical protein
MRSTITEALREMRGLNTTDAGRLRGIHLRYSSLSLPHQALSGTPQPWREQLDSAIAARGDGTVTTDTPEYVVLSDNTVVAVLTVAGRVWLPDYPLSSNQAKHQHAAAQALGDLYRHTIRDLADRPAARDGREPDAAAEYDPHPGGALRVAPSADPTNTQWVLITADLDQARHTVQRACGADPDQALIVTASGYGTYGRDRHRLDLDILCAMHQVTTTHEVSLCTVGNWLAAEGTTTTAITAPSVVEQFARAYIGAFPDELTYTRHRMGQLGWTSALEAAGIADHYLNTVAVNRDWFTQRVRQVDSATSGRIEVFHRNPPA